MPQNTPIQFHLHLVSDSTGETLTTIAKATMVQYPLARALEHVYPLVRTMKQLDKVVAEIERHPGIVLYTMVNQELTHFLENKCESLQIPCVPVLRSILEIFSSYMGATAQPTVAAQHSLNAEYFRRIEALNFTMAHDDGQLPDDLEKADIVVVGISRTSKTPTSIYLANRGFKTANIPLVPEIGLPTQLESPPVTTLVVGLIASVDRIGQVRRNRINELGDKNMNDYVDPDVIKSEIAFTRRLCAKHGWPVIDVTRRSIEETAAAIIRLFHERAEELERNMTAPDEGNAAT